MRILVTGATGFIGRHLVERLCADGHDVFALVRDKAKGATVSRFGAQVVDGDVTDCDAVRNAMLGVQAVFHLASRVTDWGRWDEFESATVHGTENVLRAAAEAKVGRFVHLSSVAVYDDREARKTRVIGENTPQGDRGDRTHGFYARAKVLAEAAVWSYHRTRGLPVVILRPALVYGPDDQTTLPRLIDYLRGRGAMWVAAKNPTIDPIYVTDVVDCAVAAMQSQAAIGQAYNVAPEREWGVKEFWRSLCRELGIRPPSWTIPCWIVAIAAIVCETLARAMGRRQPPTLTRAGVSLFATDRHHDPAKAVRELGWRPRVDLQEGLRLTVRSMRTIAGKQLVNAPALVEGLPQAA